jgi:DNA polymerase V
VVCCTITIFAHTSRFREDLPQSYIYRSANLTVPTNDHQELVSTAVKMLRGDWKESEDYFYKKAGVIVWGICRDNAIQGNLFDQVDREKQAALAKAIEAINRKNGHNKIRVAVQGNEKGWQLKREYFSKQYTTNLDDVIVLKVT